ncbi:ABC transporter permease [Parachryseolinea silvisoli]|uniref:ABC transporter permease n=1 Tax=Parachryseolinea silvisoli TaxID=2873601 RepID=UPI002265D251|nr:ABC transporter permease [Parachryseolinea silvisoli]MCD9015058.1 ABC transporter permease [Parachryseolinea silvisoli]
MLKNYFVAAIRNLYKNKGFSIINILGLSIGLASFMVIALYVYHESSFDRYHKNANRIYRIVENLKTENELLFQAASSPPMGPAMQRDFPEVESYVRFVGGDMVVRRGDVVFIESTCLLADSTVFQVFSWPLIAGDARTALTEPKSVVLTRETAIRYFGNDDPIGQTLDVDGDMCKVTGVMEDVPENSHFPFTLLMSFSTWSIDNKGAERTAWFWNSFNTYLLLREGADVTGLRAKMKDFIDRNVEKGAMYYEDLPLQALTDIYMKETPRSWERGKRGSLSNLYILSFIGLFILLIACFNYVNLATARASRRLKEVGLRKVLGAHRRSLIAQFLSESLIVSLLATVLGVGIGWAALPLFNTLLDTTLSLSMVPTYYIVGGLAALTVLLGIVSGIYPALIISGFSPLEIFRPSLRGFFSHQFFRRVLVSVQFVISITLIAGTLLVFSQLELVRTRSLGFHKDATLLVRLNGNNDVRERIDVVKDQFSKLPGVVSVTASNRVPGEATTNLFGQLETKEGNLSPTNINTNFIDHDFLPAYGIPMVTGRNFSRDFPADDTIAFIVNETAMKDFGWTLQTALGKRIEHSGKKGTVIGVCKDFHYRSLHQTIEPLLLTLRRQAYNTISLKVQSENTPALVSDVEKLWKQIAPAYPFTYSFLEEDYNNLYQADAQLGKVAGVFSGLAIFVGCLGLFGLTSFAVARRVKEMSIRKVLGASVSQIILILSREFIALIAIAFAVSIPITYYLVSRWLINFTERIDIGPMSFIIAGVSVLALAWCTVSFLSFRAATANPSDALRQE